MTTPDTLASLPKKWRDNHRDDNDGPCSLDCADELEAAIDALVEKWRKEWRDGKDAPEKRQHQLFGKLECADELDGTGDEVRGRGARET